MTKLKRYKVSFQVWDTEVSKDVYGRAYTKRAIRESILEGFATEDVLIRHLKIEEVK